MTLGSGLHFLSLIICINYMIESVQKEPRSRLDQGSIAGREDRYSREMSITQKKTGRVITFTCVVVVW